MGEILALIHEEVSEALGEHRAGHPTIYHKHQVGCANQAYSMAGEEQDCTCTPKPEGLAAELGDCIIRCLDVLHFLGVDVDQIVADKMAYNDGRPFKHGKAY